MVSYTSQVIEGRNDIPNWHSRHVWQRFSVRCYRHVAWRLSHVWMRVSKDMVGREGMRAVEEVSKDMNVHEVGSGNVRVVRGRRSESS